MVQQTTEKEGGGMKEMNYCPVFCMLQKGGEQVPAQKLVIKATKKKDTYF